MLTQAISNSSSHSVPGHLYNSFLDAASAWLLNPGAVVSPGALFSSISAAHNAAPTVFVKLKKMPAIGMSSSSTAGTPKLHLVNTCTCTS